MTYSAFDCLLRLPEFFWIEFSRVLVQVDKHTNVDDIDISLKSEKDLFIGVVVVVINGVVLDC